MQLHSRGRLRSRLRPWPAWGALAIGLLAIGAFAVTHVYDEYAWTKQTWEQWKLPNPLGNPTDENPGLLLAYPDLANAPINSLDGPWERKKRGESMSQTEMLDIEALDDTKQLEPASKAAQCSVCHTLMTRVWQRLVLDVLSGEEQISPETILSYLRETCEGHVGPAVLSRSTIYRMEGEAGLQQMVFFVMRERRKGSTPTSAERLAVKMSCRNLVHESSPELIRALTTQLDHFRKQLKAILDRHGLQTLPAEALPDDISGVAGVKNLKDPITTMMVETAKAVLGGQQPRPGVQQGGAAAGEGGAAQAVEGAGAAAQAGGAEGTAAGGGAAQQAAGAGGGEGQQAAVGAGEGQPRPTRAQRAAAYRELMSQLISGLELEFKAQGLDVKLAAANMDSSDDEYADDDDEEDAECKDLHVKCRMWADAGECEANPNYMLTHCRKSCAVCTPKPRTPPPPKKPPTPEQAAIQGELKEVTQGLLQSLKSVTCTTTKACLTGVAGTSFDAGVGAIKANKNIQHMLQQHHQQQPAGGFVLGKPTYGAPQVLPLKEEARAALAEKLGAAAAAAASDDGDSAVRALQREVDGVLDKELGGVALLLPGEFFVFEYVYKNHTRHFHPEDGKLTEDWLLGRYAREAVSLTTASGGRASLDDLDLLPDRAQEMKSHSWPYVKQVYNQGDECVLAGNRRVVRRTEVRIACSPDDRLHLLIREPDFCSYIWVIYSPALCTLPEYQPAKKS